MKCKNIFALVGMLTLVVSGSIHPLVVHAEDSTNAYNFHIGWKETMRDPAAPSLQFEYPSSLKTNFYKEGNTFPTLRLSGQSNAELYILRGEPATFNGITGTLMDTGKTWDKIISNDGTGAKYTPGIYMGRQFSFKTNGYFVTISYEEKVSDDYQRLPDGRSLATNEDWDAITTNAPYLAHEDDWNDVLSSLRLVYNDLPTGPIESITSTTPTQNTEWKTYARTINGGSVTFEYPSAFKSIGTTTTSESFRRTRAYNELTDLVVEWVSGTSRPTFIGSNERVTSTQKTLNGVSVTVYDVTRVDPDNSLHESYADVLAIPVNGSVLYIKNPSEKYAGGGLTETEWEHLLASVQVSGLERVSVTESMPTSLTELVNGTLIKSDVSPVVYRMMDGKRQPFWNEELFHLWYPNFDGLKTVTGDQLAAISLGSLVLPPKGTWIKIDSVPKVYQVEEDGKTLRWISSEAVAKRLRGAAWMQNIKTIDVTLYQKFVIGESITQ